MNFFYALNTFCCCCCKEWFFIKSLETRTNIHMMQNKIFFVSQAQNSMRKMHTREQQEFESFSILSLAARNSKPKVVRDMNKSWITQQISYFLYKHEHMNHKTIFKLELVSESETLFLYLRWHEVFVIFVYTSFLPGFQLR